VRGLVHVVRAICGRRSQEALPEDNRKKSTVLVCELQFTWSVHYTYWNLGTG
jgi:hypothetical protein